MVNYDKESCDSFQRLLSYFYVEQMAMLWCGINPSDFNEVLAECEYIQRGVPKHPYIECLESRAMAIMDAIEAKQLAVGRDGRKHEITEYDHVAPERRTILLKDFKEWLIKFYPNEKPKLIFDDIERNIHTSITIEAYQVLKADRDHLQVRINKAEEVYKELKKKLDLLEGENASLKNMVDNNLLKLNDRSETTYLNIIGGLLDIMLKTSPSGQKLSVYDNQSSIISALLAYHDGKAGISARTLESKFASANKSIKK
ncbi:protein kinase [Xenorhabdus sp. XENO-1]|uniref:protein kinase n=1 Tax=Xenorhabdus bovienii TaxID=40576 RepID=UPI0020CA5760|nr:protein kinase [Xenorhabdus bovienii]MCP9270082.1 protein kinase [Xenorhabdus bovienii subsp. africana]